MPVVPYTLKPLTALTESAIAAAGGELQITAGAPCKVTVKGFNPGDPTFAPKPFLVTVNGSATPYTFSAGNIGVFDLTPTDILLIYPSPADATLSFAVSCERFEAYHNGEA